MTLDGSTPHVLVAHAAKVCLGDGTLRASRACLFIQRRVPLGGVLHVLYVTRHGHGSNPRTPSQHPHPK